MKKLTLIFLLALALQDNCGTAGSIQDTQHTSAKRAVDTEDARPTPQPEPTYEPQPTFETEGGEQ